MLLIITLIAGLVGYFGTKLTEDTSAATPWCWFVFIAFFGGFLGSMYLQGHVPKGYDQYAIAIGYGLLFGTAQPWRRRPA